MSTVEAWICGWNREQAKKQQDTIKDMYGISAYTLTMYDHEAKVVNHALTQCQADYFWYVEPDVDLLYEDTLSLMVDWLDQNPDVGLIRPNREGEPPAVWLKPADKYLDDGTAWLYRRSIGKKWDTDFIFTGWGDLDWGNIIWDAGYRVQVDPRTSVYKHPTPYGSWSNFRRAFGARNRLLLEAKWYWSVKTESGVAVRDWRGFNYYNSHCHPFKRIPTMFELAGYSEEMLEAFFESVNHEHPQIQIYIDGTPGNLDWELPE